MKAIIKFLHEARTELIKVSWPSRNQAINLTLTVIIITVVSAAFIGGVDYLLTQGVKALTTIPVERSINPSDLPIQNIDIGGINLDTTSQQ